MHERLRYYYTVTLIQPWSGSHEPGLGEPIESLPILLTSDQCRADPCKNIVILFHFFSLRILSSICGFILHHTIPLRQGYLVTLLDNKSPCNVTYPQSGVKWWRKGEFFFEFCSFIY